MSDSLGTWENGIGTMRLEMWDTGRTDYNGKSELRYVLTINGVEFAGDRFHPSPMIAIDSDESAGALIGFFAHYGESLRYSGDDAECAEEFTPEQREVLASEYDELSVWSHELEEEDEGGITPEGTALGHRYVMGNVNAYCPKCSEEQGVTVLDCDYDLDK